MQLDQSGFTQYWKERLEDLYAHRRRIDGLIKDAQQILGLRQRASALKEEWTADYRRRFSEMTPKERAMYWLKGQRGIGERKAQRMLDEAGGDAIALWNSLRDVSTEPRYCVSTDAIRRTTELPWSVEFMMEFVFTSIGEPYP